MLVGGFWNERLCFLFLISFFLFFFSWYILFRGYAVTCLAIARPSLVINVFSALFHKYWCFGVWCQRWIVSIVIYLRESARYLEMPSQEKKDYERQCPYV